MFTSIQEVLSVSKFYNSPLFNRIALLILFILSCFTTYYSISCLVIIITHYGRLNIIIKALPIAIGLFIPMITFIFHWFRMHTVNIASKYRLTRSYAILIFVMATSSLVLQIISNSTIIGWDLYPTISPLFPYNLIVLDVVFIVLSINQFIYLIKNKELRKVPTTFPGVNKALLGVFSLFVGYACYFAGNVFTNCINMIGDGFFDTNFFLMIPVCIILILPCLVIMLNVVYIRMGHLEIVKTKGLYVLGITYLASIIWLIISYIINPRFIPQSMTPFFQLGTAAKIPLGLIVTAVILFIILAFAFINLLIKKIKKQ